MKQTFYYALSGLLLPAYAAAQTQTPNIVVIMTDQQRADLCGREGFQLDITPFVDSLAAKNAWFDKAYTSMPASSPARCSMLTGRYPSATAVRTNHNIADIRYQTDMIKLLKNQGYKTALVGKNHAYLKKADMDHWSEYGHWGKNNPQTEAEKAAVAFFKQAVGQWIPVSSLPLENQQPVTIVSEAIDWIDAQKQTDSPFFLWVSFPEPHNPYQVCEPYYSMFSPDKIPAPATDRSSLQFKDPSYSILASLEDKSCPNLKAHLPRLRGNYMGMIRLIDDQIRRLIETLKANGTYDNTIFVILSDHGDYCGEYGLIRKGAGLSDCLTRIPMVWAGYGIDNRHNTPIDAHVSIADIFPTICTAIGADIPIGVQGRSLWPMLTGKPYPEDEFASILVQRGYGGEQITADYDLTFEEEGALGKGVAKFDELNSWTQSGTSRMLRKGDWKLILDSHGNGELYNVKSDPSEIENLYNSPVHEKHKLELMADMMSWELRLQDPLPTPRNRYRFEQNQFNYHNTTTYERNQPLTLYVGDGDWKSRSLTLAADNDRQRKEYGDGELPVGYSTIMFNHADLPVLINGNPEPVIYLNGEKCENETLSKNDNLIDNIQAGDVVKMYPSEPDSYELTYTISQDANVKVLHDRVLIVDHPSAYSVLSGTESNIIPAENHKIAVKSNNKEIAKENDGRYTVTVTSDTHIDVTSEESGIDAICTDLSDPTTPVYNIQGIQTGTAKDIDKLPTGVYIVNGLKVKI